MADACEGFPEQPQTNSLPVAEHQSTGKATICGRIPPSEWPHYLVTLAVIEPESPSRIVATVASGLPVNISKAEMATGKTVCAAWDGLDDNFMPVPAGVAYGVSGIYSRASVWPVDGQLHTITAEYVGAALPFAPIKKRFGQNLFAFATL